MRYEIDHRPSYAVARISLDTGERIKAETATMITMSDDIKMQTGIQGGVLRSLRRSTMAGGTFFLNTYTAEAPGEVALAPHMPGDVEALQLYDETVYVQSGSFLAATMELEIDSQWGGARTFFTSEGMFLLRCSGTGTLFISSYGAIHRIDLRHGQKYTVDNGHMVAFDDTVRYSVGKAGGWTTTLLGGEGIVCRLEGPGRFFLQTRSEQTYLDWLAPKLALRAKRRK